MAESDPIDFKNVPNMGDMLYKSIYQSIFQAIKSGQVQTMPTNKLRDAFESAKAAYINDLIKTVEGLEKYLKQFYAGLEEELKRDLEKYSAGIPTTAKEASSTVTTAKPIIEERGGRKRPNYTEATNPERLSAFEAAQNKPTTSTTPVPVTVVSSAVPLVQPTTAPTTPVAQPDIYPPDVEVPEATPTPTTTTTTTNKSAKKQPTAPAAPKETAEEEPTEEDYKTGKVLSEEGKARQEAAKKYAASANRAMNKYWQEAEKDLVDVYDVGAKESQKAAEKAGTVATKAAEQKAEADKRSAQQEMTTVTNLAKYPKAATLFGNIDPRFVNPEVAKVTTQPMANEHTKIISQFKDENNVMQTATAVTNKYGDAVMRVPRSLRSFGEQLAVNYAEVLKWSIAVGLLYTPMRKLSELTQVMIENQTKLAQVAVTLGASQEVVNKIFVDASVVAKQTGTDLMGVIEGYNLAFRATGNAATMTERFSKANERLVAAITLSKLANIEQSTATDILTASIEQLGEAEDANGKKGITASQLLDRWVAVSKAANVDVNTLATSFSIVGEAATAAGLNIDQLNGLIATIGEKSSMSASQTGNAVRAIISGFQTDTSEKALQKYGIAIKDTQGNLRSFSQVFGDIQQQFQQGLITPTGLSDIARQMSGQGNRRQAQEIMAILGYPRMNEIAGVSAGAPQGIATKAMETLVNTIGAQLENLNTDFQVLAQTLGTSGGILDATSTVIKVLEQFTIALNGVAKWAGAALPFLTGIGAMSLIAGKGSPFNIFGQLFGGINRALGSLARPAEEMGGVPTTGLASTQFYQNFVKSAGPIASRIGEGLRTFAPVIGAGIASSIAIGLRFTSGDTAGGFTTIGTTIAGGLLGIIGGPAGMAVGATIGTAIGEAFASKAKERKEELAAALEIQAPGQPAYTPYTPTKQAGATKVPETILAAEFGANYQERVNMLNESPFANMTDIMQIAADQYSAFTSAYDKWRSNPKNAELNTIKDEFGNQKILEPNAYDFFRTMAMTQQVKGANGQFVTPVSLGQFNYQVQNPLGNVRPLAGVVPNIPMTGIDWDKIYQVGVTAAQAAKPNPVQQSPYLTKIYEQGGFGENVRGVVKDLQKQELDYIDQQFRIGKMSAGAATTQKANINIAQGQITNLAYPAVGGGMNLQDALQYSADIVAKGTADEVKTLVQQANDIKDLYDKITTAAKIPGEKVKNVFDPTTGQMAMDMSVEDAQKTYDIYVKNYVDAIQSIQKDLANRTVLAPRIDVTKKGYTREDIMGPILTATKEYNDKIVQGYKDAADQMQATNPTQADELRKMAQAYANAQAMSGGVLIAYENGTVFIPGISSEAFAAGETLAKESSTLSKGIDITQWDIKKSQVPELKSIYDRILAQFTGAGYTPNLENTVVYTEDKALLEFLMKDGQDKRIDAKVMQIALGELNDKAQKELDGMYNLPEGTTFWVPYQAAVMSRQTINNMPDTANTTATNNNTTALNNLTAALTKEQLAKLPEWTKPAGPPTPPAPTITKEALDKIDWLKQYPQVPKTPPNIREEDLESMLGYYDKLRGQSTQKIREEDTKSMENYYKWLANQPEKTNIPNPNIQPLPNQLPNGALNNALLPLLSILNMAAPANQTFPENFSATINATIPLTTNVQVLVGAQQLANVVVPIVKKELASALGRFSNSTSSFVGGGGGPLLPY